MLQQPYFRLCFLIFRDVVFNRGLICLIWMVLCGSKMELEQFFCCTDLFATRVSTYIFRTVHRFRGSVKIVRQFHIFLVTLKSQLLQCEALVKSTDFLCFTFLTWLIRYGPPETVKGVGSNFPHRISSSLVALASTPFHCILQFAVSTLKWKHAFPATLQQFLSQWNSGIRCSHITDLPIWH